MFSFQLSVFSDQLSVFSDQLSVLFVDDDGFAMYLFVAEPEAIDLGTVTCGNEGLDMVVADKGHDRRELILGQERLDLEMLFSALTALNLI